MRDRVSVRQDLVRDTAHYLALREELAAAGCFAPSRLTDAGNILFVLACAGAGYGLLLTNPFWIGRLAALLLVSFAVVQAGFLGHDACHRVLSKQPWLSATWGHIFLTWLGGVSYAHFSSFHREHHAESFRAAGDDVVPTARSSRIETRPARYGRILFGWILVSLQGFTLRAESVRYVVFNLPATRIDAGMLAVHVLFWLVVPALILGTPAAVLNYVLFTVLGGPYTGAVFLGNHDVETVNAQALPFLRRLLADTRNLGDTRWDDLVFGGINHHVEHHLYPTISRGRLRTARRIVRDFCHREQLPYREGPSWRVFALISCRFAE